MKILFLSLDDAGVFVSRRKPYINHAIGLIRTVLSNAGIKTDLKDLRCVCTKKQVKDRVCGYDILLMSVLSFNYEYAVACAKIYKECNPEGKVIVGGVHFSTPNLDLSDAKHFDLIIRGPGEKDIIDAVKWENNMSGIETATAKASHYSLDKWPTIDRSLCPTPLEDYSPHVKPPTVSLITSRRCNYNCGFCNESKLFDDAERRSPGKVVSDLKNTHREFPFRSVMFHDSNFFDDMKWINKFINDYSEHTSRWPYWCSARSNVVCKYPDMIKDMVVFSNLSVLSLGLESGHDNTLKYLNKCCTASQNMKAIELCNSLDLKVFANIMIGIPGETEAEAMATVKMVNSIKNAVVWVSFFNPYPWTTLGKSIIECGRAVEKPKDVYRNSPPFIKGVDYKFYYKKILPKIKGYRHPALTEKIGRYFMGKLASRILKT